MGHVRRTAQYVKTAFPNGAVSHRFEELSIRLNQPETAADPALFRRLMQEYHEAEPVVQAYQALITAQDHLAQAKALLEGEALDPDFKEMVQQEIGEKSQEVAQLENNLKILLLPKDVNDDKSVIMELRGGAGGEEAALFAHSLMRMYTMYVQSRGWELEVLNLNETELGGVKEAILAVNGAGAYNRLKYESGVHRVQRVPETETQGRIHTSTATVAVMPQAEEVDLVIDPKDLRIDTFRSSARAASTSTKRPAPSGSRTSPPEWWWSARTSAASSRIRIRRWRSCAAACWPRSRRNSRMPSMPTAQGRWEPVIAARRSGLTTSRRIAAPTTASA